MSTTISSAYRTSRESDPSPANLPHILAAEETIAAMSDPDVVALQQQLACAPADPFNYLWLGLAARARGQWQAAIDAFGHAIDRGCVHWRVGWYIAQAARSAGQLNLVDEACAAVLKANPGFWFARELPKHGRGYYSQLGQDRIIEEFFTRHPSRTKVFVEVGAFDGVHYSNVRRLHETHGWSGIAFEPVSKNFRKLAAAYAGSTVRCVQSAVSTSDGELAINVSTYPHLPDWGSDVATLGEADTARWQREFGAIWTREQVPVRRLTRLLDEAAITDFDFISIDTEGHDLEVLRSIDFARFRPQLIVIEYGEHKAAIAEVLRREGYATLQDNGQDFIAASGQRKPRSALVALSPATVAPVPDLSLVPAEMRARVLKTIACRDADTIPKVPGAGEVLAGDPPLQVMHNGVKIIQGCYHGDWMTQIIRCLRGHHEPQEERVFHAIVQALPPGAVMIEAGSFWAYYSLWFHHAVSGAQNHLIEPNEAKLEAGRRNFAVNGFAGTFTRAFIGSTSAPTAEFVDWDGTRHTLARLCIDDYVTRHDIPFVHVLHADIQGAELDLLRGCTAAIAAGRIGYVVLSTHHDRHEACLEFLRMRGFQIIAEHSVADSASVDGLIVASSPAIRALAPVAVTNGHNTGSASPSGSRNISPTELPAVLGRLNPHLVGLGTLPRDRDARLETRAPLELLTPDRFDLPAKLLYARHRAAGVGSDFARRVYAAHIAAFSHGTCTEGDGRKHNLGDYFAAFDHLLDDIKTRGFDPERTLVPLGRECVLIDGGHRAAACLLHQRPIATLSFDVAANRFGSEFFARRGLAPEFADACAIEYCRWRPDTYVVAVFPSAVGRDAELRAALEQHGRIVHARAVTLNRRGARNLIREIYAGEPWLGDWRNGFAGTKGKMEPCFRGDGPLRVFVFQAADLGAVREAKAAVRALFGLENHSVHINDTHADTLRLARLLLNANSIHFLNHAEPRYLERFVRHLERYRGWLRQSGRDPEDFAIDGSAVMAAYGLRDAQDLDVLHFGEADFTPVMPEVNSHNPDAHHHTIGRDDIIFDPANHFHAFGAKFAALHVIRALKVKRDEGKDRRDVALIDACTAGGPSPGTSRVDEFTREPPGNKPVVVPSGEKPARIVALIPARNEAGRLPFCLRSLKAHVDAVVYLDDCSDDDSVRVVESLAAECKVERIIRKEKWHRDEPGDRNALLEAGRRLGGTHFVVLDADEAFTANCARDDYLRRLVLSLRPGESLAMSWIQLWRSPRQYRFDASSWTYASKAFAFCDDGCATYRSGFIHTLRIPQGLGGRTVSVVNYVHGVLHFQFVDWPNLQIKQAWYRCLERIRQPKRAAAEINEQYAPSENEAGRQLRDVPADWFAGDADLNAAVSAGRDERRVREVLEWFRTVGVARFAGLDIWRVDWAALTDDEALAAQIRQHAGAVARTVPLSGLARQLIATGNEHLGRGDLPASRGALEGALAEAPGHPQILATLGSLHMYQGQHAQARQCFEAALATDPQQPQIWVQLAAAQRKLRHRPAANAALQRALELDGECVEALQLAAEFDSDRGRRITMSETCAN